MTLVIMPIDYLTVGHLTRDLKNNGFTLGGSVAYSGLMAKAMGREVGIVTSFDDSLDTSQLANLHIFRLPSEVTTTFENSYEHGVRNQILHAKSTDIGPAAIPLEWRSAKLVHLGPIANEVNPQVDPFQSRPFGNGNRLKICFGIRVRKRSKHFRYFTNTR